MIMVCVDCGIEFYTSSDTLRCPDCRKAHKREYHKSWRQTPAGRKDHQRKNALVAEKRKNGELPYLSEEVRLRRNEKVKSKIKLLRNLVLEAYGGKCENCGTTEHLTLHHSFMNGSEERARVTTSSLKNRQFIAIYSDLVRRGLPKDEGLIVLCNSCHMKEHWRVMLGKKPEIAI